MVNNLSCRALCLDRRSGRLQRDLPMSSRTLFICIRQCLPLGACSAELLGRVGDEEAAELSRRMSAAMTKLLCRRISDDDDRQRRASRVAAVRSLLEALGVSSGQVADAAIDARLVANDSSNPVVAVTKELAASIGHRWETTAAGPSPSLQEKA